MNPSDNVLKYTERVQYALRSLYRDYGYQRYKVSKFEEYDLYAYNKSFLVSENILTFTDTNGKLMALKPDVTLSIVKNVGADDPTTHKVYYNENVYRTAAGVDGFREIMQTGLECIGKIDLYTMAEVLTLAQKSLAIISADHILDLSHLGLVVGLLEAAALSEQDSREMLGYIGNKNLPAIAALCKKLAIDAETANAIGTITELYEPLDIALDRIAPLVRGEKMREAYDELCGLCDLLRACGYEEQIRLDFSIVNDMSYYNGIIFRGYVNGIPDGVLAGGRYDAMLARMGKRQGAIGFAVYLDLLERMEDSAAAYDTDVLLIYGNDVSPMAVAEAARSLREAGECVLVEPIGAEQKIRYRKLLCVTRKGVMSLEAND